MTSSNRSLLKVIKFSMNLDFVLKSLLNEILCTFTLKQHLVNFRVAEITKLTE